MQTLGERVKFLRESRGLSQQEVADGVHSSRSHISSIETDFRFPSDILIHALCSFFSVREDWLRTGELPIRERVEQAIKDEVVKTCFALTAELSPSIESLEVFLQLMQVEEFSYMVNYLCYRAMQGDKVELKRMAALFSVAFPEYRNVMEPLFRKQTPELREALRNPALVRKAPVQPAGAAAAGIPLYNEETNGVLIELPVKYLDNQRFFSVEVKGDSMSPHMSSGDIAIVARDVMPEQGQVALIHTVDPNLNDGYMIKRYYKTKDGVKLVSYNPEYPDLLLKSHDIQDVQRVVFIASPQG